MSNKQQPSDQPPAYPSSGYYPPTSQQQQGSYPPQQGGGHPQHPGAGNFQAGQGGYPPPPPVTYPPGGGYPGRVLVVPGVIFRNLPVSTVCQHCHASITTQVTYDTGVLPWVVAGGLLLFGCWLGCCLIPFCIDDLKDAIHTCPQCRQVLGQYKRM